MKPCKRCGICCTIELCSKGRRSDKKKKGHCKYLIHNDDGTTSCQLILENKMKDSAIEFKHGCIMQEDYPHLYEFYYELKKENMLK
jgi:hypothetical protein